MTVQVTGQTYTTRRYAPDDEAQVLALLRQSLGESDVLQRTSRMWQWKHVLNPFGPSYARVAVGEHDEIIGLRAFMRWQFRAGDRLVSAVRAVDTATHPGFQRLGIFSRLTREAVEDVRSEGTELVFNTPNAQSLPGYLKLGWETVGKIQPLVRVLRYRSFALGMARHRLRKNARRSYADLEFYKGQTPRLASALILDDRLEGLLHADARLWKDALRTPRSAAYLGWRYASHPTVPYRAVTVEVAGTLKACAIFRTNSRFGLKEVVVSELFVSSADRLLVSGLLHELRTHLDADYLIAYFPESSFHRWGLEGQGFHRVPGRAMTLVANQLAAAPYDLCDPNRWGMSLGDLEFF